MAVVEIEGLPEEPQNRDLLLLDVSELLQNTFADATLIGRLDATSFGLLTFQPGEEQFRFSLDRLHHALQSVRPGLRVRGATVSVPAGGPCDLEQLLEEARPKAARKTVCWRIDKRSVDDRAGHHVQRGA